MPGTTLRALAVLAVLSLAPLLASAEDEPVRHEGRDAASWAVDLSADSLDARRKAVYALWHLDQAARPHVRALARALADDDEYVRATAERVLTRFGWQRSINTLSGVLPELIEALTDERASVRFAAVKLIWAAGPQPNVVGGDPPPETLLPALVKALGDEDARGRANAAAALANLQKAGADAVPALTARLTDGDVDVRMWAVRALAWIDGPRTFGSVLALASDESAGVRAAVLEAAAGASAELAPKATAVLTAAVTDENLEVRRAAVSGLWALGRTEVLPTLERVLKEDADAGVRAVAAQALGGIGDPAAVPALMAALESTDEVVRTGAAGGLCRLGPEGAVALPRLVEMLASGSDAQRRTIAMTLGQLAPWSAPALPALRAALADENPSVRAMAASTLSALARHDVLDDATLRAAIAALADTEAQVLQYAVPAIANLESAGTPAVPALLDVYARNPEGLGRSAVLYAFQRIGPGAAAALLRMEGEGASDAVEVLAAGLRGETPVTAMRALDDVGAEGRDLIPVLLEIAGESGHAYRTGALGALLRFGALGESVRAVYGKARQDASPWIRTLGQQGLYALEAASADAR